MLTLQYIGTKITHFLQIQQIFPGNFVSLHRPNVHSHSVGVSFVILLCQSFVFSTPSISKNIIFLIGTNSDCKDNHLYL